MQHDITPEVTISKTQRRTVVGYHPKRGDTSSPALNLSGKWLRDAGFDTETGVTVKISEGCLILIAEHNEIQELRKELYQVKQDLKGMRDGMFSVLNES